MDSNFGKIRCSSQGSSIAYRANSQSFSNKDKESGFKSKSIIDPLQSLPTMADLNELEASKPVFQINTDCKLIFIEHISETRKKMPSADNFLKFIAKWMQEKSIAKPANPAKSAKPAKPAKPNVKIASV